MDNIPKLSSGTVVPDNILLEQYKEAREEAYRKKMIRHDWMVASFSALSGAIFGLLASIAFWIISG